MLSRERKRVILVKLAQATGEVKHDPVGSFLMRPARTALKYGYGVGKKLVGKAATSIANIAPTKPLASGMRPDRPWPPKKLPTAPKTPAVQGQSTYKGSWSKGGRQPLGPM